MDAAHDAGARITAHVFGRDALPDIIDAGFDSIEHGTGLDEELIDRLVDRDIALVPTLILSSDDTTQTLGFGEMTRISGTAQDGIYQRTVTEFDFS